MQYDLHLVLGFAVWAHHLYTTGLDVDTRAYFTTATSLISFPTGIKIFHWLRCIFNRVFFPFSVGNSFIVLFISTFVLGGVSGIICAFSTIDILIHDSLYIVGHFHYVLSLAALTGALIALYGHFSLFINFTSSNYHSNWSLLMVGLFNIGANLIFLPMHYIGLNGIPRRIGDGYVNFAHFISSYGLIFIIIFIFLFLFIFTFTYDLIILFTSFSS